MDKADIEKEIDTCLDFIRGISDMLKDFYGTKEQYLDKLSLFKEYNKRLESARKQYVDLVEEELD